MNIQQALVEDDAGQANNDSQNDHKPHVAQGKRRQHAEMEDRRPAEDVAADHGRQQAAAMDGARTTPEKLRCSSSRANMTPAKGALKAAARPALAPAVMR